MTVTPASALKKMIAVLFTILLDNPRKFIVPFLIWVIFFTTFYTLELDFMTVYIILNCILKIFSNESTEIIRHLSSYHFFRYEILIDKKKMKDSH